MTLSGFETFYAALTWIVLYDAAYDKRKYLWKLMYTKMLGYDVEFGHKQAMDMMAATTYGDLESSACREHSILCVLIVQVC